MTVPNTPAEPDPLSTAPGELISQPRSSTVLTRLWAELRIALPIGFGCLLLGLLMGALWYWLAPEVPLVVQGNSVLYGDPEGEQSAGAVATFVLLGLAFGLVTALVAFLLTRRRGGGIAMAVALGLGGVGGSLIAVWLGEKLGPTSNIIAHARQVGDGHTFYENLTLPAHGALLAWPIAAMVLLLALTATFGRREEQPEPQWAGPLPPAADGSDNPWAPPGGSPPADGSQAPSHTETGR
ncbi:hypothetical protein P3T35_006670 [Kitasatospora sp. GP30]|uniref:hypothetical protein n=1 Tax=Kitasatospora sp. GP30 TaxID=3035084 RepID=UPI000CB38F78|nr:hypothetical protein [Kitasatospora sp. GP30]MDH6144627.1 hypothetical protein [Kitasatospora sp. GP30]